MIFTDCFRHVNVSDLDFLMSEVLERESVTFGTNGASSDNNISMKLSTLHTSTSVSFAAK